MTWYIKRPSTSTLYSLHDDTYTFHWLFYDFCFHFVDVSTDSTLKPHQAVHCTSILHTIDDIHSRQIHNEEQSPSPVQLAQGKNNARNVNELDRLEADIVPRKIENRTGMTQEKYSGLQFSNSLVFIASVCIILSFLPQFISFSD